MTTNWRIRDANADDLDGLLTLYRELNPDDAPIDRRLAERVWRDILGQPGRRVLVAMTGSTPVGTVDCFLLPNLTRGGRPILFVEDVVVAQRHRREGVGTALLEAALSLARTNHAYKAQLLADPNSDLRDFYGSCGFAPTADGFRRYL